MLIGYLDYLGFAGTLEYDTDIGYHGEVVIDNNSATYEAFNLEKLYEEFKIAVDKLAERP